MNKIKYNLLDYYLDPNFIAEMYKKFEWDKMSSILSNYSKKGSGRIEEIIELTSLETQINHRRKEL